jgi:hypothetical protein
MEIDWQEIADAVLGTCMSETDIIERYELDGDEYDLGAKLSECGVELCADCNWWAESSEMNCDFLCADCQPEDEDE